MDVVGVDFGTSNSAVAVPRADGTVDVLPIDPFGDDARLFRSVLFFPEEERRALAGGEAIRRYLDEGEGRFLQSIKSFLPSTTFERTEIQRRSYRLEELVSLMLKRIREQAEKLTGTPIERAVFGRPAVFGPDAETDALAQERLSRAAELAGFGEVTFVIEPIAAALSYEASLDHDELVLVGDFGAGTSDFTLMRLGPEHAKKADRREDVIASSGVRLGGDRFDAAIVEHRLLDRFGAGSTYLALHKRTTMPVWMTRKLLAWHELSVLREKSNLEFLKSALRTSDNPEGVDNLIRLAEENLAYHLYRAVEAAKRRLSEASTATIRFTESGFDLEAKVTRKEFETWTAPLREELDAAIDRCLQQAGREPDAVFLTGGTSRIPSVRAQIVARFGEKRLREGDAFTSVVAGLGHAARGLAA